MGVRRRLHHLPTANGLWRRRRRRTRYVQDSSTPHGRPTPSTEPYTQAALVAIKLDPERMVKARATVLVLPAPPLSAIPMGHKTGNLMRTREKVKDHTLRRSVIRATTREIILGMLFTS